MKMKRIFTQFAKLARLQFSDSNTGRISSSLLKIILVLLAIALIVFNASAQLAVYDFAGAGTCPNQNLSVVAQPSNAVFSNLSATNVTCNAATGEFSNDHWNKNSTINLGEYIEFTVSANSGYVLNLSSISFTHSVSENGSGSGMGLTAWILRSSLNNYATNISSGSANQNTQSPTVNLPAGFSGVTTVTFRLYITLIKEDKTTWEIDDITVNGAAVIPPADPANPTSNAPQCSNPGVTLFATGTPPPGVTWYWQTSASGTSTANSGATYVVTTPGT